MGRLVRHATKKKVSIAGIAWFQRDQWLILKETADDPEVLHPSYDEWVAAATLMCEQAQAAGYEVRKINVEMAELIQWCAERDLPLTGKSRSQFAVAKVRGDD